MTVASLSIFESDWEKSLLSKCGVGLKEDSMQVVFRLKIIDCQCRDCITL